MQKKIFPDSVSPMTAQSAKEPFDSPDWIFESKLDGYRAGHSGSGFSEKGLRDALDRMMPLFTDKSPFENQPRIPQRIQWVKPKLVCEISFAEWTQDGELRQTVFLGWRDDKKAKDVVLERGVKSPG